MTVEVRGARQLNARFKALGNVGQNILAPIALRGVAEAKKLAPVRTGNLRRTIHLSRVTARSATVTADAAYARAVEFGSRPHDIRPRKAKVLRFKVGGRTVFTRHVRHPGNRPQPFLIPGLRKAIEAADGLREKVIRAWNGAA